MSWGLVILFYSRNKSMHTSLGNLFSRIWSCVISERILGWGRSWKWCPTSNKMSQRFVLLSYLFKSTSKVPLSNPPYTTMFSKSDGITPSHSISTVAVSFPLVYASLCNLSSIQKLCSMHRHLTKAHIFGMEMLHGSGFLSTPQRCTKTPKAYSIVMRNDEW